MKKRNENTTINILKAKIVNGSLKPSAGVAKSSDIVEAFLKENIFSSIKLHDKSFLLKFWEIEDSKNLYADLARIENYLEKEKINIIIGGNHVISYAGIKKFKEKYKDGKIIIFDAHPDAESDFFISNDTYLRILIKKEIVAPEDIILIGIRNSSLKETEFLKKNKITLFTSYELLKNPKEAIRTLKMLDIPVYVSIDIDSIDPSYAPGTNFPESFGITPIQLFFILENIRNIKLADIVEIDSEKDINNLTCSLGAHIIYELCYLLKK
ncbi:MAG: arginase family protein [Candidatus Woesearchaeota archaeon]